jgi:dihydrofolate reductase
MPKVIADITMSLDGFVTGEGADEQHGLGDAPELHTWVIQQDTADTEILEQATAGSGAVVMGRRLFDVVNAPDGWNEDMGYGADQTGTPPFFVVTHSPLQDVRLERELGLRCTFVSDLVTAIDQARSAATHGDVVIMGGGDVIGQALEQGLVDELRLHLAPMVLGGGTPLFKRGMRQMYRQRDVRPSRNARAPHLRTTVDVGRDVEVRRRSTRAPEARRSTSSVAHRCRSGTRLRPCAGAPDSAFRATPARTERRDRTTARRRDRAIRNGTYALVELYAQIAGSGRAPSVAASRWLHACRL